MTAHRVAVITLAFLTGCGNNGDPPPDPPIPVVAARPSSSITALPSFDPASGMHIDPEDPGEPDRDASARVPARPRARNARVLGIMLRSAPSGAIAAVDGQPIGATPAYWEGEFTGGEREFTFALAGHAVARYRFVPVTSGVVFGHLEPIALTDKGSIPAIPRPASSSSQSVQGPPSPTANEKPAPPSLPVTTPDVSHDLTPAQDGSVDARPNDAATSDGKAGDGAVAPLPPSP
jgi:hypothetical protein